ncbi:hypothetical protein L6R52_18090 [Myxococcota bacterium]|nr:hypothetical protein [Myxococcota bacterium]
MGIRKMTTKFDENSTHARRVRAVLGLVGILATAGIAAPAAADEPKGKLGQNDPPVAAVVAEALRYFRVNPEAIRSLRSSANTRALVPVIAGGFRYEDDKFARFEEQMITDPRQTNEDTNRKNNAVSVGAVWDLRELVFNPGEVQVYGLVGIQRDLMLEVTRTYFLRKQLVLLRTQRPPTDPVTLGTLDLRIAEYDAILDVMTGGWFSKASSGATKSTE